MRYGIRLEVHTESYCCCLNYWDVRNASYLNEVMPGLLNAAMKHARTRIEDWSEEAIEGIWPYGVFNANEDNSDVKEESLPGTTVVTDVTIYWTHRTEEDDANTFIFPFGVLPSNDEHKYDPDEIAEAYLIDRIDDDHCIRMVIDGRRILEVFMKLIEILPSVDNLEISWSSGLLGAKLNEVWLSPPWGSRAELINFLKETRDSIFEHGNIELGVYSSKEHATLRLTEHKEIEFYCKNDLDLKKFEVFVESLKIKKATELFSLSEGFSHFHFCKTNADRGQVVELLKAYQCELVHTS